MLINNPGRTSKIKGKITYSDYENYSNQANISQITKKNNKSTIFSPIEIKEKELEYSSSDSEFVSILGSERNLICKRKDNAVLKTKVISGNSPHKLSNFILYKQGRNRNEVNKHPNVSSESQSFINGIHSNFYNNYQSRFDHSSSRIIHDIHNISEIKNDTSNYKVLESGNFFKSNNYASNANTTYNPARHRKNQNSNYFNKNNLTKNFSKLDKDIDDDFKKMNKTVLLLSGENDFFVKKKRMFGTSYYRTIQEHGNENSEYGGRIDLINNMKYNMRYLRREKLNEIILIQSVWRSRYSRKRRRLMKIITIQSHWRGHWLRLVVYNSIFRYYSGRAFWEHIHRLDSMNRLKYGKVFIKNLKNYERDYLKNEEEKLRELSSEKNLTYVKSKKLVIFKNVKEKKEPMEGDEISNNLNSTKKNFAAERYENKQNSDQIEIDRETFVEEEGNLFKIKEIPDRECEPNINTNYDFPKFKEIFDERVDEQFEFKDDEEHDKKSYVERQTQTLSKLDIIKEYLENKVDSMELIQNESFNITSNFKQIKKFDSLLEEFTSFTIEMNKLANTTKNYIENVTNLELQKGELSFVNFKFPNEKLLKFEAERFNLNREIEKLKTDVIDITQLNLDYAKLENEINHFFKDKYKTETPSEILDRINKNKIDTSVNFEGKLENPKGILNTKSGKLRNNRIHQLDFSELDSDQIDNENVEFEKQSNFTKNILYESYKAYDLSLTFSSLRNIPENKPQITKAESYELIAEFSTKLKSIELKVDLDLQKVAEIYYIPLNQKRDSLKYLEITEESNTYYATQSKIIQLDFSNEYNIIYNPISSSVNEDFDTETEKIKTEFVMSVCDQVCFESNPKKYFLEVFKEAEVNYQGINRIKNNYLINKEYDFYYLNQQKSLIQTVSIIEEFYLNGIKKFKDVRLSKENEFNYPSLLKNSIYHICKEANIGYNSLSKIKNLEMIRENEINYESFHRKFHLDIIEEASINYIHPAKIFNLQIFNQFEFNFTPINKDYSKYVIEKGFEINYQSHPRNINLEIKKESEMVYLSEKLKNNSILKEFEFVYTPDPNMTSNLLFNMKEIEIHYKGLNKQINLQEAKQVIDIIYKPVSKSNKFEILQIEEITYLPESKPAFEIFNLYNLNHIKEEHPWQPLQIESTSEAFITYNSEPKYEIFTLYEISHLPLEKILKKENFEFEFITDRTLEENKCEFSLYSFTLNKIREFTFNYLEQIKISNFSYDIPIKFKKNFDYEYQNCISICIQNLEKKENLIVYEEASITYDKSRGVLIKNISEKISEKIKFKIFNRFNDWLKKIQKLKFLDKEKLLKKFFSFNSIFNIVNKRNKNNFRKRFQIWKMLKNKISHKLIATIVVKKLINVINKNVKSSNFEDLVKNLLRIRNGKIKSEKIKSIFNKLENKNYYRKLTEFNKLKIISIRKNFKENLYRFISKKLLNKGNNKFMKINFDLWKKKIKKLEERNLNSKIFIDKVNFLFFKIQDNFKLKSFDQLKFHAVEKVSLYSLIQIKLKYLFFKHDKHYLLKKWSLFKNQILRKKEQEKNILIKQIDSINLNNHIQVSLRKIINKKKLINTLQIAKSCEKWKYSTSNLRTKSYKEIFIDNDETLKFDLFALEKLKEEKEVSCDFRHHNYPLQLDSLKSFECIPKSENPTNKFEIISSYQIECLTTLKEALNHFDIQKAYDLQHVYHSIPLCVTNYNYLNVIASTKEVKQLESFSQTENENIKSYDVYDAYKFSIIREIQTSTKETNTEMPNHNHEIIQTYDIEYSTANSNKDLNQIEIISELSVVRKSYLLLKFIQNKENKFIYKKLQSLLKWKYAAPPLSERKIDKTALLSRNIISTINENIIQTSYNNENSSADMISFVSNSDSEHQVFTEENEEEFEDEEIEIESIKAPIIVKRQIVLKESKQRNNRSHSIYTIKKFLTLPNGDELEYDLENKIYSIFVKYENPLLYYFNKWVQTNSKLVFNNQLTQSSFSSENEISIHPHMRIIKKCLRGTRSSQLKKFRRSVREMRFSGFARLNLNIGYYFSRWKQIVTRIKRYALWFRRQIEIKKAFLKWKNLVLDNNTISVSGLHSRSISYKIEEESLEIKPNLVISKLMSLNNSVSKTYESNQEDYYEEISEGEEEMYSEEINEENNEKNHDSFDLKEDIKRVKENIAKIFIPKRSKEFCFKKWRELSKRLIRNDYISMKLITIEYIRRKFIKKFFLNKWKAYFVLYKINKVIINNKQREEEQNDDDYLYPNDNLNGDSIVKIKKINVIKVDKKSGMNKTLSRSHASSFSSSSQLNRFERHNTFTHNEENIPIKFMKVSNILDKIVVKSILKRYLNLWKKNLKNIIEGDIHEYVENNHQASDSDEFEVESEAEIDGETHNQIDESKNDEAVNHNVISFYSKEKEENEDNNLKQNKFDIAETIFNERDGSYTSSEKSCSPKTKKSFHDSNYKKINEEHNSVDSKEINKTIVESQVDLENNLNSSENNEEFSEIKLKFIESLIREEKIKKYSLLSKLSIDAMNKYFFYINSSDSFELNLTARIFLKTLRDITEKLFNLSSITNVIKTTYIEEKQKSHEDNHLNLLKSVFSKWRENSILAKDVPNPNKILENIKTYSKFEDKIRKENRDKKINLVLSKVITHKSNKQNLILDIYLNRFRSIVNMKSLSDKAEIFIKQSKKFLEEKNLKRIKSLNIDDFPCTDSSLFPTNRMEIQKYCVYSNLSERKSKNPFFSQVEENPSEKLVRTKTHIPNYDCKNKFPDILDTSVEGANFIKSSFSVENEEDDYMIISIIQIQNAWRYYKQKEYLRDYSHWLKILNKLIKNLKKQNICILQGTFNKWKKFLKLKELNEASNIIKNSLLNRRKIGIAEEKLINLIKAKKRERLAKIINTLFVTEMDETTAVLYFKFKKWMNKTNYIARCKASDLIKSKIRRYFAVKNMNILLRRAYIQFTYKTFLLFADMYNCKDRVTYLTYVLNKIIKRNFIKYLKLTQLNKTVTKLLLLLNKINITESKREILKLWLRRMKLLRRKDHSMLKMLRIIKLNVKNLVITALKLSNLVKKFSSYQHKYLNRNKKNLFKEFKFLLELFSFQK